MTTTNPCPRCRGCGKIADGEEGAPWSDWMDLPLKSSLAVLAGIVKPIPCPACRGAGVTLPELPDGFVAVRKAAIGRLLSTLSTAQVALKEVAELKEVLR